MKITAAILAFGLVLTAAVPAIAQQSPFSPGSRFVRVPDSRLQPPPAFPDRHDYGYRYWQEIRLYLPGNDAPAPLVIVLQSGSSRGEAESWLRYRVNQAGYAMATVPSGGSRPKAEEVVSNHVEALRYLSGKAGQLGLDMSRIAVVGGGNFGHFAVLLGADSNLLEQAGIEFSSLRGVVSINGGGFDIPARMGESSYLRSHYRREFGRNPEVHRRLSPINHLDSPNAPAFLFMFNETSEESRDQSAEMAEALREAGSDASLASYTEPREGRMETHFLVEPEGSGKEIIPFLRTAIGQ